MKYTKEAALQALEDMDDYSRMGVPGGIIPVGSYDVLKTFIEEACDQLASVQGCDYPLCKSEEEQQAIAEDVHVVLYRDKSPSAAQPVAAQPVPMVHNVAWVISQLQKIEHSMLQAKNPGNDRLREIDLTLNITHSILAAIPPAQLKE